MNRVFICLFLSSGILLHGQGLGNYKGKLIDLETNAALPFATIKLKNEWRGVISNAVGDFQLPLLSISSSDTLVISCIGYESKILPIEQLSVDKLNTIKLQPSTTLLSEVVIRANKIKQLSGYRIVKKAIQNIPLNFPKSYYSYLAYYRDYQLKSNEYINLNEAVVEVFDNGFNTKSNVESNVKLYKYRRNKDFKRDTTTEVAYDNLSAKFVPNFKLYPFGGNELSILLMHDAIRNYRVHTYSFVYKFQKNFLSNHAFQLKKLVTLNNEELYEIAFDSRSDRIIAMNHFAKGTIYIEPDNYAIHKLDYSTYSFKESNDSISNLLYNIKLEYSRVNSLMYLNYISLYNFFKVKNPSDFKVVDLVFDRDRYGFRIKFNNIPLKTSVLDKSHYNLKIGGEDMVVNEIIYNEKDHPNTIYLILERNKKVNIRVSKETLASAMKVDFKNIIDVDGRKLGDDTYISGNQFRELFVQKVETSPPAFNDSLFISIAKPLSQNKIHPIGRDSDYFMNTPLKKVQE